MAEARLAEVRLQGGPQIGIQSVSISRVAGLLKRFPGFETRFFTENERRYCRAQRRKPDQHFAARLAAKLAARKMVGAGRLLEFEVVRDALGAPQLIVNGSAAHRCAGKVLRLSISHEGDLAVALAVMVDD